MKKRKKHPSKIGPSPFPQHITDNAWYYEDKGGIILVVEQVASEPGKVVSSIRIKASQLRKSLARMTRNKRS